MKKYKKYLICFHFYILIILDNKIDLLLYMIFVVYGIIVDWSNYKILVFIYFLYMYNIYHKLRV
jgi:hypothetical protein